MCLTCDFVLQYTRVVTHIIRIEKLLALLSSLFVAGTKQMLECFNSCSIWHLARREQERLVLNYTISYE